MFLKTAAAWGSAAQRLYSTTSFHCHDNDDSFTLSTENSLLLGSISFLAETPDHVCVLSEQFINSTVDEGKGEDYMCSGGNKALGIPQICCSCQFWNHNLSFMNF